MALRASTCFTLLGLATLLPAASGCGARSDLAIGGSESSWRCADGSRAGAVGCASVAFADAVSYPVGVGPSYGRLLVADLNGDGALDLAVPGGAPDAVTVLLNQGDGVFSDGVPYATSGPNVLGLSAGDLNQDGAVDLVIGTAIDDSMFVSVLLNDGHGAFAPGVLYAAGLTPISVALGDLDGDGLLDIATANLRGDNVSVLSNLGDGTFASPVTHGPVWLPSSIAAADLNRDGRLDLAVASAEIYGVSVLLNAGGGTFAGPIRYHDFPAYISDLAVGDVNGDGWPDLVDSNGVQINVLLNAGDGAFGVAASYPGAGSDASAPAVADLNGDCRLDIAAISVDKTVMVLPNLGDGDFGPADAHFVEHGLAAVAAGDLNGDGKVDLAVTYWDFSGVSVLLNQGCGP